MRLANTELTAMRNDDLLRAVNEVVKFFDVETPEEAVALAIKRPSKRFWCSSQSAERAIWRIRKGETLDEMLPTLREQYFTLYDLYLELRETDEFRGKSVHYICAILVEQPAPKFYLTVNSALKIYKNWRLKRLCERTARLMR